MNLICIFVLSFGQTLVIYETSASELEIIRDISRTFPTHVFFQQRHGPGQRSLYNILKAYSVYDRDVGYVQVCVKSGDLIFGYKDLSGIIVCYPAVCNNFTGNGIFSWAAAALYERGGCILVISRVVKGSCPCTNGRFISGN